MHWNVAEAKNKLSEVLNRADDEAQIITRRDREYILMSGEQYRRIVGVAPDFLDHLIDSGPKVENLDLMPRIAMMREPSL